MASLIHELENNEALLLMYSTGELPPEDSVEVEQMLAADAGLRAELAEIQSAHDGAMNVLARLDGDRTAVPAENHAIRQAMRAMKQWQVDRLARQPILVPPTRRNIPVWLYPLASAAALLIGTIAWWGFGGFGGAVHAPANQGVSQSDGMGSVAVTAPAFSPDEVTATRLDNSLSHDASSTDPTNSITDAESQANSLVARSDSASVASDIFLTEANP
jgi:anti-sigma factor RsiW